MRTAGLIHISDCPRTKFNTLRRRDQLPFQSDLSHEPDEAIKWQEFSLDDAFALRLQLDLMGNDDENAPYQRGIPPAGAVAIVSNAIIQARSENLLRGIGLGDGADTWLGIVVFEGSSSDDESVTSSSWVACPLATLGDKVEELVERSGKLAGRSEPARILIANASRAARFVYDRALKIGLPEADRALELA